MNEFKYVFFGCVDVRVRDNEAVHGVQVLLDVDRSDIELRAHLFENLGNKKLGRSN